MQPSTDEQRFLEAGVARLIPLLSAHGFVRAESEAGRAHSYFATTTFRRGTLEIGLIVRDKNRLGCPAYSAGDGYVGHTELLQALDPEREAALVLDEFVHFKAADSGDPFEALRADLAEVVLPAIANDETGFRRILTAEVARWMAALRSPREPGRDA